MGIPFGCYQWCELGQFTSRLQATVSLAVTEGPRLGHGKALWEPSSMMVPSKSTFCRSLLRCARERGHDIWSLGYEKHCGFLLCHSLACGPLTLRGVRYHVMSSPSERPRQCGMKPQTHWRDRGLPITAGVNLDMSILRWMTACSPVYSLAAAS